MKRVPIGLAAFLILHGCGQNEESPLDLSNVGSAAIRLTGLTGKLLVTCGPSRGRVAYSGKDGVDWEGTKVSRGAFAIVREPDRSLDVVVTNNDFELVSVRGYYRANVIESSPKHIDRAILVTVIYPGAGIVESYSVFPKLNGEIQALWTSNTCSPLHRAAVLEAACEAPNVKTS